MTSATRVHLILHNDPVVSFWIFICNVILSFFFSPSSQSEREEFEAEYKEKYERDRVLLTEENKKLSSELDKVKIFAQIYRVQ